MAIVAALAFSSAALATEDHNLTITIVGTQSSGSVAYFSTQQGFSVNCAYGIAYIDLTTTAGQNEYATILTAKSTGATLTKVDYTQNSDGTCHVVLVEYE